MKVWGPLMSVVASGTIGKLLTYSHRGLRSRVHLYATHRDAGSAAQLATRAHWTDAIRFWKLMDDADRGAHNYTFGAVNQTGYNAWVQQVVKRKRVSHDWLRPRDIGKAKTLGKFEFWLAGRDASAGGPWDISGRGYQLVTSELDEVVGDRGSCWRTDDDTGPTDVDGTTGLGDLEELTIGIRVLPVYDQAEMPQSMTMLTCASGSPTIRGFALVANTSFTNFNVWDNTNMAHCSSSNHMEAGVWREYVCVFQGGSVKQSRMYIDGELDVSIEHELPHMESNTRDVYVMHAPWAGCPGGTWHNAFVYKGVPNAFRI